MKLCANSLRRIKMAPTGLHFFSNTNLEHLPLSYFATLVRASIYNPDRPALSTNSASLEISSLSLQIRLSSWEICSQRQVSLQFHHLVGCYHPKKLKIERRQKAKLWEKQCTYFHDSCYRRHFDSPETVRAQFHILVQLLSPKYDRIVHFLIKAWNLAGWYNYM